MALQEGSQVSWVYPQSLQFCAFVGEHEGFSVLDDGAAYSPLEAHWRQWWEALIAETDEKFRMTLEWAPPLGRDVIRQVAAQRSLYDPPTFPHLKDRSALRERCLFYWRPFARSWNDIEREFYSKLTVLLPGLSFDRTVEDGLRLLGKQSNARYVLRLTFVRWPPVYQRHISLQHVMLATRYLDADMIAALEDIVASSILKLL
jgi:hypothetical protein